MSPKSNRNIVARIHADAQERTFAKVASSYQKLNAGLPFEFRFLDDHYNDLYVSEHRIAILTWYFAALAILISCLGLFGLAAFTVDKRIKEIGIRKVLGSTQLGIVSLLSGAFNRVVFVAILIALPLSYLAANSWLNNFAYRIELQWWYFAGAGSMALFVAWLTVATQAVKAAMVNPVQCLRDE